MRRKDNEFFLFCECGDPRSFLHLKFEWPSIFVDKDGKEFKDEGYICISLAPPELGGFWSRLKYAISHVLHPSSVKYFSDILIYAKEKRGVDEIEDLIKFLSEGLERVKSEKKLLCECEDGKYRLANISEV